MKNNLLKKIIKGFFMILIITFFSIDIGFCLEGETVHSNKYYGEYFTAFRNGTDIWLDHFRIYSFSGRPAYGIDLDNKVVLWNYYYTDDYLSRGLTKEQIDYIQLIAYYGYEYPSHRGDYRYFMVAQELIFEYLLNLEVYWTERMEFSALEVDLSRYKNEVLTLVSKHSILPSFSNVSYSYLLGEDIEIIDTNDVLSNYEIIDSDGLDIAILNNKIIINDNNEIGDYIIKLKRKNYINDNAYLYYADGSRTLFTPGKMEEIEVSFNISINGATLEIFKYDNDLYSNISLNNRTFEGAKYGLFNDNDELIDILIIDRNGYSLLENLSFGNYKLVELQSSYGYLIDDNVYSIDIKELENKFNVYGEPFLSKLEFFVRFEDSNEFIGDCSFGIFDEDNKFYTSITTDDNGYAMILLPYGKYTIRQNNAVDGYLLIDDLNVEIDSFSDDIISYNLYNSKLYDDVIINDNQIISNPKTNDDIIYTFIDTFVIFFLVVISLYIFKKNMI